MLPAGEGELPSVSVHRRVEFQDTDGSGHHHHSVVLRWDESAETVLLARLGATDLYGNSPRVHYDVDYRNRVYFGQIVWIELRVERAGEKSVRYGFVVRGDDVVVADGHLVVVMASRESPGAAVLPPEIRKALSTGGPQRPETIG
jgi:acyl-CoA thioesterase FadM